jgi:tight adherence protein C
MIWVATILTFIATVGICAAVYSVLSPSRAALGGRLAQLWRPAAGEVRTPGADLRKLKLEGWLTRLGKLLPASDKKVSQRSLLLARAGYRSPEAVVVMRGVQILSPAVLLVSVYVTGLYRFNPVFLLGLAALGGFLLSDLWLTSRVKRRQKRIVLGLPDGLDLLVVCVEAGMGLDQALFRVAQEVRLAHPELSDELQLVNLEMRVGKSRMEALRELSTRTGVEDIKTLVAMLIQTDRFGTDLAQALRTHSENLRIRRRQRAEEMAAKTTVKMVLPLVFFIFPALFAVLLGPAVLSLIREFSQAVGP